MDLLTQLLTVQKTPYVKKDGSGRVVAETPEHVFVAGGKPLTLYTWLSTFPATRRWTTEDMAKGLSWELEDAKSAIKNLKRHGYVTVVGSQGRYKMYQLTSKPRGKVK